VSFKEAAPEAGPTQNVETISMLTRYVLAASTALFCSLSFGLAAHADFSLVCDERSQLQDILNTAKAKGHKVAIEKFQAYAALRNEKNEPTCEVSTVPNPATVDHVVSQFDSVEFLPAQLHDVLIVEFHAGERTLYATLNHFLAPKPAEVGL
jgi:hypothetical protein